MRPEPYRIGALYQIPAKPYQYFNFYVGGHRTPWLGETFSFSTLKASVGLGSDFFLYLGIFHFGGYDHHKVIWKNMVGLIDPEVVLEEVVNG